MSIVLFAIMMISLAVVLSWEIVIETLAEYDNYTGHMNLLVDSVFKRFLYVALTSIWFVGDTRKRAPSPPHDDH